MYLMPGIPREDGVTPKPSSEADPLSPDENFITVGNAFPAFNFCGFNNGDTKTHPFAESKPPMFVNEGRNVLLGKPRRGRLIQCSLIKKASFAITSSLDDSRGKIACQLCLSSAVSTSSQSYGKRKKIENSRIPKHTFTERPQPHSFI
ncbi:hypothetical protein AVEN_136530-1 [Araneus ventricosus]|uniref:Uncharacterized protein n=2 Tax=Araneus ventricosus TaxID=182803 RepID=A0A4Y2RC47_ARAVE|nr:hypothetical protein AVEN_136530-1 [Araneus ventricosus]